ncbi:cytochrome P450 [Streptomyces sp. CBMA152]|uniref:cytochrome P450 n=1 Tax=Streptomyces sp. CBMA152 TaxID=1896312 RepID=UPI001660BA57|nr:cytochrome P450 [Streptomyces sp. CBMA152]MBD0742893.1 cytochrome [Streptomyces sp. CBMA152]
MRNFRSLVTAQLARICLAQVRRSRRGDGGSPTTLLPDSLAMALRRDGLEPVVDLDRKREAAPVVRAARWFGVNAWLVTGYGEVKAVLGTAGAFSNDFSRLVERAGLDAGTNPGGLGFSDPPDHTRLRRLLTPEFTMRRLGRLAPRIQEIVDGRLDAMAQESGPVDLVRAFALPVPALTICELLGVPHANSPEFQRLSVAHFDVSGEPDDVLRAASASLSHLMPLVREQRESPGDGLLGMLVREHGDEISDRELAGLADGVLTGGLETTASMLALGTVALLADPVHLRLIRDEVRGPEVDRLVEELLRYLSVVQVAFPRFVRRDIDICGVTMRKGDVVVCSLSGANRDHSLGPGGRGFDPARRASAHPSHMAFGHGIHRCIGAELARMELRIAYPALVRRFPAMRLAIEPHDIPFRKLSIVYGVEALPVLLH